MEKVKFEEDSLKKTWSDIWERQIAMSCKRFFSRPCKHECSRFKFIFFLNLIPSVECSELVRNRSVSKTPTKHLSWSVLQKYFIPFSRLLFWQSYPFYIFAGALDTPLTTSQKQYNWGRSTAFIVNFEHIR